jgi:hypothetical protein
MLFFSFFFFFSMSMSFICLSVFFFSFFFYYSYVHTRLGSLLLFLSSEYGLFCVNLTLLIHGGKTVVLLICHFASPLVLILNFTPTC